MDLKEEAEQDDTGIWKWLADIMRELGPDGTSSDKSRMEDGIKEVYYTKVILWRRELERELRIINEQRLVNTDLFTPRGLKLGKRI